MATLRAELRTLTAFWLLVLVIQSACSVVPGDVAFRADQYEVALRLYKDEYRKGDLAAGLRLAAMYSQGLGTAKDEGKAFSLFKELADKGLAEGYHNLGVAFEYGKGTSVDYYQAAYWYRKGASVGYLWSVYNLGTLYANQRILPNDDIEGLALLMQASAAVTGDTPAARFIANDEGGHIGRMTARMSNGDIDRAKQIANSRPKLRMPKP